MDFHSRYSVVGITTRLRAGLSGVWIPAEARQFSLLQIHPDRLCRPPSLLFNENRGSFQEVMWPWRDADQPPSSAEDQNEWSCTSAPPIRFHGMYRDNLTFNIAYFNLLPFLKRGKSNIVRSSISMFETRDRFLRNLVWTLPCWRTSQCHSSWTAWPLKMGSICCPETSVTNYQSTLRNIPEERSSHLRRGGSLKSRIT